MVDGRMSVAAKRTMSARKVLYAIFFPCEDLAIQGPVLKDTGGYYHDVVQK